MDVDTTLPWHVQHMPFLLIPLARPRIPHVPKLVFFFNVGTERMTTNSLVPFRSARAHAPRRGLRHVLSVRKMAALFQQGSSVSLVTLFAGALVHMDY